MGLYTIVASIPGDYPGFALADKAYYINTTDKEAILEIALQEKADGICTTGTDVAWLRSDMSASAWISRAFLKMRPRLRRIRQR